LAAKNRMDLGGGEFVLLLGKARFLLGLKEGEGGKGVAQAVLERNDASHDYGSWTMAPFVTRETSRCGGERKGKKKKKGKS